MKHLQKLKAGMQGFLRHVLFPKDGNAAYIFDYMHQWGQLEEERGKREVGTRVPNNARHRKNAVSE